jgi:hypothetical protein
MSPLSKTLSDARSHKSTRIRFMVLLGAILVVLYLTGVIKKWFLIGLGIVLLAAIGIETMNYDLDLATLRETGSIESSRVQRTSQWVVLYGQCVTDDLNCADFGTQSEAQKQYDTCIDQILERNPDVSDARELDVYGLDRDLDGVVCEALPVG